MEAESPTRFQLFLSWLCIFLALALMGAYGNAGWVAALLPMLIAIRIRRARDEALFDRMRASGAWQRIALTYYGALLIFVLLAVWQGRRVDRFPFVVQAMVLLFPGFACMAWNDAKEKVWN